MQLFVTVGLWLLACGVGVAVVPFSLVGAGCAAVVAAGFVVRLFMIQHDCGHRSFLPSARANDVLGFWLGVVTMTPYACWRRFHAAHHSASGNLDRRGYGDIDTLTTQEFAALSRAGQWRYRVYRHPLVLLVLGPPLLFVLRQRTTYKVPADWRAERRSVHLTNLGIGLLLAGAYAAFGSARVLVFHLASMCVASMAGVWLFYVQHQFVHTYWRPEGEWESWRASMEGASYYVLPAPLRWLTANIGLHHIHHLDARIPNYRLYECLQKQPEFAHAPRMGVVQSLACLRLRLWDAEAGRMVPFAAVARRAPVGVRC